MMKRFLMILVLGLLLSGNAFAKVFYISCKGKTEIRFGDGGAPDKSIYNDDWEINIVENEDGTRKLLSLRLQGSSHFLGRNFYLRGGDGSTSLGVVFNTGPIIGYKSIYEQDWDNRKILWKAFGEISLLGGTENFTVNTVYDDGRPDVTLYAIGNCQDTKEVFAFLQGEKSPGSGDVSKASGTGFFINNDGYFVTNNHVIASCNNQSKISYKGKNVSARLIAKDKSLDLALLKADVSPRKYIIISNDRPKKLQKVIAAGYPLGKGLSDDLKFTQGIISSIKGLDDNSNQIQIDAALNPGNSGGPIVNEDGELVAVAVSGLRKDITESINFGIKASSLMNFLDVNSVKYSSMNLNLSTSSDKLRNILEESTVYTFCN